MFVYNSNKIGNQFRIGSIDVDYAAPDPGCTGISPDTEMLSRSVAK